MNNQFRTGFLLLMVLAAILFSGLGQRPVYKIQEVRMAETAREMLASGDWLVPRYNGDLRLEKPPLPYWLTAASYALGGVTPAATRFPAVIFGLMSTFLLWYFVKRALGTEVAINTALTFATSFIALRYFRSGEADAVLLFFIAGASLMGLHILSSGEHSLRWAFGLFLGLGFLAKGPAALGIPLATLMLMAFLLRHGKPLIAIRDLFSWTGVLLLVLTAFGWYIWIFWSMPDAATQIISRQVDDTFISGTHPKPVWWYCAHFMEFFAPWGVFLVPAGWRAYRQYRDRREFPAMVVFSWVWLIAVLLLLTITVNKQMQYALLLAPPLSIIIGEYLASNTGGFLQINRALFWLFGLLALGAIVYAYVRPTVVAPAPVWLLITLVPLVSIRFLPGGTALHGPVLMVAVMTGLAYVCSEMKLSGELRKSSAEVIVAASGGHIHLYQPRTRLNNGALSFYAGQIVSPLTEQQMMQLLGTEPEIWVAGDALQDLPGVSAKEMARAGELHLWRLRRK